MRVRPVCVRVGFSLRMAVAMLMDMLVSMSVAESLSHRVAAWVTRMAMVVAMRWGRDHRFRNPTLFADLYLFGRLIIVLVASPLGVSDEPSQRGLIHVAGERNLRVAHAQRPRVLRLLYRSCRLAVMMAVAAGRDGKGRDDAGCTTATFRTRLLLRCLAQRRQHFESEIARRAVVFVEWHTAPLIYSIAVGACGNSAQSSGSWLIQIVASCMSRIALTRWIDSVA